VKVEKLGASGYFRGMLLSEREIIDEINDTRHALKWRENLAGGWRVELMGDENGGGEDWKSGEMAEARIPADLFEEMVRVWGRVPTFEHVWFAHSYQITPALRLMELLWELHQRGKTPYAGVGVWWHDAFGVVGVRYWFCEGKDVLRAGLNSEILDRAFVRESVLHDEHIEQEILDAVDTARRKMSPRKK